MSTLRWFGPALAYCALIFFLSHQPVLPAPPGNDKLAHFVAYGIMGGLFVRALYFGTGLPVRWVAPLAFVLATLYGVSDEWHQSFVPGRHASVGDVVADMGGALAGSFVVFMICRVLTERRRA